MTITIKRTAADELSQEEWTFWVHDSHAGFNIVLDHYTSATRPTKRHGWRQSDTCSYSRLFRNNMRMNEASSSPGRRCCRGAREADLHRSCRQVGGGLWGPGVTISAQCSDLLASAAKPAVPAVLPIVNAYMAKPGNGVGGSLHIVLCDGNTDGHSVEFCQQWAAEQGDEDGEALARVLLRMSRTQRLRIARENTYP